MQLKWQLEAEEEGADAGRAGGAGASGSADAESGQGGGGASASGAAAGTAGAKPAIGEGGGASAAGNKGAEEQSYWPKDWRQRWAKDDSKRLNVLSRYASPEAAFDAMVAAQDKIRSGEHKRPPGKDATPEQLAEWRKDHGIPESHDKYDLKFDSGLVVGKEDQPVVDEFLKRAHATNMSNDNVKATIEWYYDEVKRQADARQQQDVAQAKDTEDVLRQEWGGEYRGNLNMITSLLTQFPETVRDAIKAARLPDGRGLFNDPDVLRGFAAMAREVNPAATLVPGGSGDVQSIDTEIAKIEKVMTTNRRAYNKDEAMQARYRQLLEAREKLGQRKAA